MKHEELVEKITELIAVCVRDGGGITRYITEDIITLILSAVRDGLDLEELAALEHEQWVYWSKQVADEVLPETRARWETYWKPYEELSEAAKNMDRIWARKVIALREEEGA